MTGHSRLPIVSRSGIGRATTSSAVVTGLRSARWSNNTRKVVLVHLGYDRSAVALRDALIEVFDAMPASVRRSLTRDQGKEMAGYLELAGVTGMPVNFCQAHSPWQRGSNENMNDLLRDYFPRHTDLRGHDAERLAAVAAEINKRPRKTLHWATPADLFGRHLRLA
jgi:IS30 family transposase